ncbi:MAG: PDZ domain-containing protein [Lachnospiraceae bacterium]|nr:PDZ domain-containing protein [Lachnospiraceae bacterium]
METNEKKPGEQGLPEEKQEYTFIRQEVKPRRARKYFKKLFSGILLVIPLAVLFGFLAFLSFSLAQKHLNPPETTTVTMEPFTIETVVSTTEPPTTESTTEEPDSESETESEIETTTEDPTRQVREFYSVLRGIAAEAGRAIVRVTAVTNGEDWFLNESEKMDTSFGLILSQNSKALLILTPYDPIAKANEILVTFRNGSEVEAALYSHDEELGMACLQVDLEDISSETQGSYDVAVLGDSTGLDAGVSVIAVGAPNGYLYSVEFGIVSNRKTTEAVIDNEIELFNTDLPEHPNGSGVILNLSGQIVGLMTHRFNSNLNEGLSTCYSIAGVRQLIEDLAIQRDRPYLGIYGGVVQPEMSSTLGVGKGIYISKVIGDSPAFKAGMERGDIIVSANGTPVEDFAGLQSAMRAAGPGGLLKVEVIRTTRTTDNEMTFDVTLTAR